MTEDRQLRQRPLTDLIGAFNAANPARPIARAPGWTPALRTRVDTRAPVPQIVDGGAGAGRL